MVSGLARSAQLGGPVDNLRDFMLAAAARTPDRPAVIELGPGGAPVELSYRQLERRVDGYVAGLAELGLEVGDRVVLESLTTADGIAALLACCTLGLPFVPVSPDTPDKRLLGVIEAARPALVLQAAELTRDGLPPEVGLARFAGDELSVPRPPTPTAGHRRAVVGTDPAYIIFTSGTTGRPKGVVMSHRANLAFHLGAQAQQVVRPQDRVAIASPFHFDLCLGGIGLTLGAGATVVPVPRARLDWPRRFLGLLRDLEITQVQGVPSIWRAVLRHEPEELAGLDRLAAVLFSGEDFPIAELRQLRHLLPGRRIINCYGATESMACSFTDVPDPLPEHLERPSIGWAHAGAEMAIFDPDGRPIEDSGVPGEIYLRSPALFDGYWDDGAASARALVRDPLQPRSGQVVLRTGDLAERGPDGDLFFLGRVDSQVQIRGNRVELGEVERRLLEYPGVNGAVALALPGPDGEVALTAFLVLAPPAATADLVRLRAFCRETLPEYMAPRDVHVISALPLTRNGKTDRAALTRIASGQD